MSKDLKKVAPEVVGLDGLTAAEEKTLFKFKEKKGCVGNIHAKSYFIGEWVLRKSKGVTKIVEKVAPEGALAGLLLRSLFPSYDVDITFGFVCTADGPSRGQDGAGRDRVDVLLAPLCAAGPRVHLRQLVHHGVGRQHLDAVI